MSNRYLIHMDTSSVSNVSITGQASVAKVAGNPFQCTIILGNRHRRIRAVSLKNAQIPIGFYNIRAPYNTMVLNGTTYTVAPGNYNSTSFLAAVNAALGNGVGVFAIQNSQNIMTFTANSGSVTFTVTPPSLLSFMGFTDLQSGAFITAPNSYIINFDSYIRIWIENLGQSSLEPSQTTFKIPVNVAPGSILQWTELGQFMQRVEVTDRGARLDRLNITVIDRYGNIINNNGLDWSFTLEIEADN